MCQMTPGEPGGIAGDGGEQYHFVAAGAKPARSPAPGMTFPKTRPVWRRSFGTAAIFEALPLDEVKRKTKRSSGAPWLIANHYVGHWNGLVWNMERKT